MKKLFALLMAVMMCVCMVSGLAETAGEAYKIGVVIPLSGNFAFFSAYFSPILDIYVRDLNEAGGINGHPVELVYKDNQGDATITAQRLDELLEENVSAVIGPFMDTCGPAAAQWATENKIPVVMCCALSTEIGMANQSDYVFCAGSSAWAWAKVFANAVNAAGYESAYYVGNEGGVPDDVYNFFWEEMKKLNPDVENIGSVRLSGTESDLSSVIASIMMADPDVVVTSLTGGGAITFISQAVQFGLYDDSDMYGVYIEGTDHTESLADSYPCGSIWAIDWFPVNFAATQDWAEEIYNAAGGVIPNGASFNFYMAAATICEALKTMDFEARFDSDKLVEALEQIKVASPLDGYECYYTDYSHQMIFPMYFSGSAFSEKWGNIALPDESDYTMYGAEVYPTKEEWLNKAAELGYDLGK